MSSVMYQFVDELKGTKYASSTYTRCDECGKEEILLFGGWGKRLIKSDVAGKMLMQDICPSCVKKLAKKTARKHERTATN